MESQSHKSPRRAIALFGGVLLAAVGSYAGEALAQSLHDADLVIRYGAGGAIETGLPGPGGVEWGRRVARGRLDLAQFANLSDDPGFDSSSGAFPGGTTIGLDLLAALRQWDGVGFETIDPGFVMSVTKGSSIISTPAADQRVPGFAVGSADANGRFHHHVRYFLSPYDAFTQIPGMWLLQLELWSTDPAVTPSGPVFIVFANGAGFAALLDEGVAWVEANLLGGGGCNPADLSEPFGVLDLSDITAFVGAFVAQDPAADLAEPTGVFDLADLTAFVTAFTGGCP